jgi:hypothetical protein
MTADTSTNLPLAARIGETPLAQGDRRASAAVQALKDRAAADPLLAPLGRALADPRSSATRSVSSAF